jgi:hypothetical protein
MCILADFVRPDKFLSLLLADFACLDDGHRAEFVVPPHLFCKC